MMMMMMMMMMMIHRILFSFRRLEKLDSTGTIKVQRREENGGKGRGSWLSFDRRKEKQKMRVDWHFVSAIFLCCFYDHLLQFSNGVLDTQGYTCSPNHTISSCQTYVFYQASAPDFLDLASIADLFWISRLEIAHPSNISNPSSLLLPNQPLFVPITCSCNSINDSTSLSYANISFTIRKDDTLYLVSSNNFQNLTTYQSVEIVNPTLVPTRLLIGVNVIFPIFCKCPSSTRLSNRVNFLVSYVLQPSDNFSSIGSRFGVQTQSIIEVNGNNSQPFDTLFIPVNRLPNLTQPVGVPSSLQEAKIEEKTVTTGLAIGLAITGLLLLLVLGLWNNGVVLRKKKRKVTEEKNLKLQVNSKGKRKGVMKEMERSLMADVSDCLDKYSVFGIEELNQATDGFDEKSSIQGSVYKGCINGEIFAVKKMKWNAYQELKILQKVNHGNIVKLEGFCVDPEDASCYLVYEYVENGSLHSWLHEKQRPKLSWKTRLRIAIDVANGLQYIHEHTRPKVVHKDIKSSNILLDGNMRAKIANFGLAKSGCNAITTHIVGTQGYIAPEYIGGGVVSTKMDVFSFGVVLLELISGREAIDEEGDVLWVKASGILEGKEEERVGRIKEWVEESLLEQSGLVESVREVTGIAIGCVQKEASKRPSMVEIVYALSKNDELLFDISEDGFWASPLAGR